MQFFPEQVQDEIHGLLILAVADGKQLFFDFNAVFGNGNDDANHKFQILTSGGIAAAYNNAGTAGRGLRPLRTTSAP